MLLGLLSMVLLVTFTACHQRGLPTGGGGLPSEFRIGYQLTAGPETLVKGLGLMEEQFPDVAVEWLSFDSGRDVNDAIAQGTIDVGLVGSVPVSTGIAQDWPSQVYFIINIIGDTEALAVTPASGINSLSDLPGKSIAVPFGSTSHFSLLAALEQANINPDDLQILDRQPPDILEAWQLDDIDGGFVWYPTLARMLDEGGSLLISSRQLAETGVITADLGVVSNDFAAQYPDFLTSYVKALDTAVNLYRDEPTAASEVIASEIALSPAESLELMDALIWLSAEEQQSEKYLGTPEAPGALSQVLKDSAEFMVEQEAIPSAPELQTYQEALYNQAIIDAQS